MAVLYNTANTAIDLDDFGVTVPSLGTSDISHIRQGVITNSVVLLDYVTNSVILIEDFSAPSGYMSVPDALQFVKLGLTAGQVGISRPTRPGIISGAFYGAITDKLLVDDNIPMNHLQVVPLDYMGEAFNRIGISISNSVANGEVRLGVYANENGLPGALLLDAGVVPADTTGAKEIIIDFTTPNDWCFICSHSNFAMNALSVTSSVGRFGNIPGDIANSIRHFHTDYTYVSNVGLPDPFPNTVTASNGFPPYIWFRSV